MNAIIENEMVNYKSENASYRSGEIETMMPHDDPRLIGNVDYPHIIFRKDDGTCGMKVRLEEIVDVWLQTLEPELQQKLELEETMRSEKRELAKLRKEKDERDDNDRRNQVQGMLKPFLKEQILNVLSKRGLEVTKSNICRLIAECKEYSTYHTKYDPKGILFTEKEWDEFREKCKKIWKPNFYKKYATAVQKYHITNNLTELKEKPISFWK